MIFKRRRGSDAGVPGCASCGRRPGDAEPVLTCPGCGTESDIVNTAITHAVARAGRQSLACTACEQVAIVVEPDMLCPSCSRLRPDVNDRMRARYAAVGPGDPADAPCVGCGYYLTDPFPSTPSLDLLVDCQRCGDEIAIAEDQMSVGEGVYLQCGICRAVTVIPDTVWCPKCGLRLRAEGIPELVRDATLRRGY